jgi:hypothetical protein
MENILCKIHCNKTFYIKKIKIFNKQLCEKYNVNRLTMMCYGYDELVMVIMVVLE